MRHKVASSQYDEGGVRAASRADRGLSRWRGVDSDSDAFRLNPARMAAEIAAHPKGTVTWVYMTSDGGLTLESSFLALRKLLPPHVQLVRADTAAGLALGSQPR